MAWTYPIWQDVYAFGPDCALRTGMFELIRAVQERQVAIGISKSTFFAADGFAYQEITYESLYGMQIGGLNSHFKLNLIAIQTAIVSMLNSGVFTQSAGLSDGLTKAIVETAIGTDLDSDPVSHNDTRFWQAQVDALNLMLYATRSFAIDWSGGGGASRSSLELRGGSLTSVSDAWSDMLSDTPGPGGNLNGNGVIEWSVGYSKPGASPGGFGCVTAGGLQDIPLPTAFFAAPLLGVLDEVYYRIRWAVSFDESSTVADQDHENFIGEMTATIGETSFSKSTFNSGSAIYTVGGTPELIGWAQGQLIEGDPESIEWGTGAINRTTFDSSPPGTCPFTLTGVPLSEGEGGFAEVAFSCQFQSITYYFDITDELTDQEPEEP